MFGKVLVRGFLAAGIVAYAVAAHGVVTIDTVYVGYPGNAADSTTYGAVGTAGGAGYNIGKYEVTNAEWREFLTAKASLGDPNGLYSTEMAGAYGGIARSGTGIVGDPYVYSPKGGDANWNNRPVNYVSWYDAARFTNWLTTGNTESGVYNTSTWAIDRTYRNPQGVAYFIPTEDEWYKAAYHKNDGVTGNYWDYPTKSDAPPINTHLTPDPGNHANFYDFYGTGNGTYTIGSPYYTTVVGDFEKSASSYGTFDQGGNLWEWNETAVTSSSRGLRGGGWSNIYAYGLAASDRGNYDPTGEIHFIGFRVASVPEPSTLVLLGMGALGLLAFAWRRKRLA